MPGGAVFTGGGGGGGGGSIHSDRGIIHRVNSVLGGKIHQRNMPGAGGPVFTGGQYSLRQRYNACHQQVGPNRYNQLNVLVWPSRAGLAGGAAYNMIHEKNMDVDRTPAS